jgi:uncharacterized cofD-like protein
MTPTRVTALGGGHGLSATLRAARLYADDVTAVVSVADDGGSSGRLRQALGIPAPGDVRRCLTALATDRTWAEAFEHRFDDGHALGNLVIAGLTTTLGDFNAALERAATLLGVNGRVLPATAEAVVLKAGDVEGQVNVAEAAPVSRVELVPADAAPAPGVVGAIQAADQIVLGPGSLFTSVLAVVAVQGIATALASRNNLVYVANLSEESEAPGFTLDDVIAALARHGVTPAHVVEADPALADPATGGHHPGKLAARLEKLVG